MYSFPNFEPVCCSMSGSNLCFLTCIQISQEAGQVVRYSHLLKNFPQFVVIHTVKGFGVVNKAEVYLFMELSCFFDDPTDTGNLISRSSAFPKSSLYTWMFSVHVLLKHSLEDFEHCFSSLWDEHNCVVVWTFFSFALLWDWNENWPFLVLWPLPSFPNLLIDQNSRRIFLLETDNLILSFMWKCKRTRLTKTILKIKDKIGGLISRHYKTEVIEEGWYWY